MITDLKKLKKVDIWYYLANIYLFKVNKWNTRKRCELCSVLTMKHQNDVHDGC